MRTWPAFFSSVCKIVLGRFWLCCCNTFTYESLYWQVPFVGWSPLSTTQWGCWASWSAVTDMAGFSSKHRITFLVVIAPFHAQPQGLASSSFIDLPFLQFISFNDLLESNHLNLSLKCSTLICKLLICNCIFINSSLPLYTHLKELFLFFFLLWWLSNLFSFFLV